MANYRLAEREHEDLMTHLLRVRGVSEEDERAFLSPDYVLHRHDPFLLLRLSQNHRSVYEECG